jgi:hypothetical protein
MMRPSPVSFSIFSMAEEPVSARIVFCTAKGTAANWAPGDRSGLLYKLDNEPSLLAQPAATPANRSGNTYRARMVNGRCDFNCTVKEFLLDRIRLVRKVIYGVTAPYASGTYLPRKVHDACEDACAGNAGFSLLYRRIYSAGRPKTSGRSSRITYRRLADYKSAIQQIQNLRYVGTRFISTVLQRGAFGRRGRKPFETVSMTRVRGTPC